MTRQEQVEQEIRQVLATETEAIPLSNRLFQPAGLFSQLAATEEERRAVAQSALFREAQCRLTDLQKQEAAAFANAVQQTKGKMPQGECLLKWERAGVG